MSEYASGQNNNEKYNAFQRERETLESYTPEQRQGIKEQLLEEISDRERIVHMISAMEEERQEALFEV